jgi:hypothetical protein
MTHGQAASRAAPHETMGNFDLDTRRKRIHRNSSLGGRLTLDAARSGSAVVYGATAMPRDFALKAQCGRPSFGSVDDDLKC